MKGARFLFSRKQDAIIFYEDRLQQLEKQIAGIFL